MIYEVVEYGIVINIRMFSNWHSLILPLRYYQQRLHAMVVLGMMRSIVPSIIHAERLSREDCKQCQLVIFRLRIR